MHFVAKTDLQLIITIMKITKHLSLRISKQLISGCSSGRVTTLLHTKGLICITLENHLQVLMGRNEREGNGEKGKK